MGNSLSSAPVANSLAATNALSQQLQQQQAATNGRGVIVTNAALPPTIINAGIPMPCPLVASGRAPVSMQALQQLQQSALSKNVNSIGSSKQGQLSPHSVWYNSQLDAAAANAAGPVLDQSCAIYQAAASMAGAPVVAYEETTTQYRNPQLDSISMFTQTVPTIGGLYEGRGPNAQGQNVQGGAGNSTFSDRELQLSVAPIMPAYYTYPVTLPSNGLLL
jgi:hypothetical protein